MWYQCKFGCWHRKHDGYFISVIPRKRFVDAYITNTSTSKTRENTFFVDQHTTIENCIDLAKSWIDRVL